MAAYAEISTTKAPLYVVRFTGEKADNINFRDYLSELDRIYENQERLAIVFDATNASLPALKFQKIQASWLKEHTGTIKAHCAGTAYVIHSSAVRAVLRMIFLIYPQPAPYELFVDEEDAEAWALNQIASH